MPERRRCGVAFSVGDFLLRQTVSTGRRNNVLQLVRRRQEAQCLSRPLIEFACHPIKLTLRQRREVGSFREVLAQQTIGVFVASSLPRTAWITEENANSKQFDALGNIPAVLFPPGCQRHMRKRGREGGIGPAFGNPPGVMNLPHQAQRFDQ